jgi:hypothetical protein
VLHGSDEGAATRLHGASNGLKALLAAGVWSIEHGAHHVREGGGETRNGSCSARSQGKGDEGFLADEHWKAQVQVRLDLIPG